DPATDLIYDFEVSDNGPCAETDVTGNAPNCDCPASADLTGGAQTICAGETASLSLDLQGDGPWTLTYEAGGVAEGPVVLNAGETIDVTPAVTTVYTLTSVDDQNCNGSVSGSITVNVDDPPNAGPDAIVELCEGAGNLNLTTILDAGAQGGGQFTNPGGNNVTTVPNNPTSSGVYTYTLDINTCPADEATYDLTIYEEITVSDISSTCNAAQTEYTVTFVIDGGTGNYNVVGGTLTGNTFTSDPLDPTVDLNYAFVVSDDGPCDDVSVTGTAPNCDCPASAALTGGGQTICAGETASLSLNLQGDGPWTISYNAGGVPAGPVVLNAGETIDVTPAVTTVYTLTSVDDQNCNGSVSGSTTITVDNPPNAGPNVVVDPICGGVGNLFLEDILDPTAETPGTFTINGNTETSVPLTSASSGVYTYTTGNNTCPEDDATYDITIYDPISVNAVAVECNLAQTEYTVTFNITGGDGNYGVTGSVNGTLTGNTFTSDLIDGEDPYDFTISDGGPCADVVISDLEPDCDCLANGSISGTTNICAGSSTDIVVTLEGVPPFSITYQNSNDPGNPTTLNNIFNGHVFSVSPGITTTYTLTSMSDANCTGTAEGNAVEITVDSPLNVGNETITCDDTGDTYTVQFTATGGAGPINATNASGTGSVFTSVSFNTGSDYEIIVSDDGACPDVTLSGSFTCPCTTEAGALLDDSFEICTNENATVIDDGNAVLDGNDAFQYVLHDGSATNLGTVLLISNDGTFTYDPILETGVVYYISAVAGNENIQGNVDVNDPCLSVSNGLEILFYSLPTATFAGNATVCEGEEADLVVNFSGQGPWSFAYELNGNPVAGIVESAGNSIVLTVTEAGTYTITDVTDANCSSTSGSQATVTTLDPPTATVGGDSEVCENSGNGPEITFTGSAPWTFEYSINGEVQAGVTTSENPYTIPALESGIYTLVSISDDNCEGTVSGSLDVTFIPGPVGEITGGGTVCSGDEATFNVSVTGQAPWTVEYSVDGVPQAPLTSNVPDFTFQSDVSGTYVITSVTDQSCQGFAHNNDASLVINPGPSVDLSASTTLACVGQEVDITFNFQGIPPFDVVYAVNGTETVLNGILQNHTLTITPEVALVIEMVSIEDSSTPSCSSDEETSIFIQVTDLPNAPVLADDTICADEGPVPIGVSAAPGLSYSWEPSTGLSDSKISNPTFNRSVEGSSPRTFTYVLTASNEDCSVSDTMNITVEPRPQARFRFSPDPVTSEDPRIFFLNTSIATATTQYFWDFGGLGSSTSENPNFRFPEGRDGDYVVSLTAIDLVTGCTSIYTATIQVRNELLVYVPNAFTPDGDGKNDLWGPVLTNVDESDYRLTIFDRLGTMIFETTDVNQKWNGGKMNGDYYLEAGMYIWVIEGREIGAIDDFEMRGHVILLR
ncbi:MAG: gliding motility-associated C-terminal domain-containing protein, partial [Flavobacteriales bacterium]|nr:gliding motility-associated C-terminal domain-containing protein [Flavobacteriales bacterium]